MEKASKDPKQNAESKGTMRRTLKNVLKDPAGLKVFLAFCKLELSHENVLFYRDAVEFNEDYETKEEHVLQQQSRRIYERYIGVNSPLQLNLNGVRVRELEGTMDTTNGIRVAEFQSVLKKVMADVFKLMNHDPYVRFLRHDLGKSYFENSNYLVDI